MTPDEALTHLQKASWRGDYPSGPADEALRVLRLALVGRDSGYTTGVTTMTPEERAHEIYMSPGLGMNGVPHDEARKLQAAIADAIREGILAEREDCAKIANQEGARHGISPDASFGSEGYGWNRAATAIEAAIRARQ